MLPIRLQLKNFMSYGEPAQAVDFSAFKLACISGNNGEGKSALLDAVTWVLWGVARGTDARGAGADDLIRQGADEAAVVLEFGLGQEVWKVERKRRRGRAGGGLELWRKSDGGWESAGGATATNTQRFINDLLGLDYQTFINSAFLLQGRADEFTRQGPTERKQILADILNLNIFQELSERSRAQAREARTRADLLELEIERLLEEISHEDELKKHTEEAEAKLKELQTQTSRTAEEIEKQQAKVRALEDKERRAQELTKESQRISRQAAQLETARDEARRKLGEGEQLLQRADEIEQQAQQLQQCRAAESAWGEKAARFAEITRRHDKAAAEIEAEESKLQSRASWLKEETEKAAARAARHGGIAQEIKELQKRLAAIEAAQARTESARKELHELRDASTRLSERLKQLETQRHDKGEGLALLQQAEALCPVCRGRLSPERRQELIVQTCQEQTDLNKEIEAAQGEFADTKSKLSAQEQELRGLEQELRGLAQIKQTLGEKESQLSAAREAQVQLQTTQKELAQIEATMTAESFAVAPRKALAAAQKELDDLGYDAAAHSKATQQVRQLTHIEIAKAKLDEARALAKEYKTALTRSEKDLAAIDSERAAVKKELAGLQQATREMDEARRNLQKLADSQSDGQRAVADLEKQLAVLNSRLEQLTETRRLLLRRQKEKEAALERQGLYTDLAASWGKNGVQALIIETALPQLEAHANALLERLTQGRLHVSIYTQKERGGEMAETLEIRIRDESGERRYEMYSGGEAFRLNFAIRLALSELLGSRAGARLSTLIVDEGFGSQDAEGRQRLVEAVRAVAEDFDKILVITHIDELKAEFPHRIEISKDESGSHVKQVSL